MDKIYKIGLIGCGGAAHIIHLPVLLNLQDKFDVVAVCDVSKERALLTSTRFGIKKYFSNFEDLLSQELDIIAVTTGNHEKLIEKILESGINVFTEKPISLDIDISRKLVNKADSAGLLLEVGLMRLYDKLLNNLLQKMDISALSNALFTKYDGSDRIIRKSLLPKNMEVYNFEKNETPLVPNLNQNKIKMLKTLLWNGIHLLTIICMTFNNIKAIYSSATHDFSSIICLFETEKGQPLILNISNTEVPLFIEEAKFVLRDKLTSIQFTSPYLYLGESKSMIITGSEHQIKTENNISSEFTFRSMWDSIANSLQNNQYKIRRSCDMAIEVEYLARTAAEKFRKVNMFDN